MGVGAVLHGRLREWSLIVNHLVYLGRQTSVWTCETTCSEWEVAVGKHDRPVTLERQGGRHSLYVLHSELGFGSSAQRWRPSRQGKRSLSICGHVFTRTAVQSEMNGPLGLHHIVHILGAHILGLASPTVTYARVCAPRGCSETCRGPSRIGGASPETSAASLPLPPTGGCFIHLSASDLANPAVDLADPVCAH